MLWFLVNDQRDAQFFTMYLFLFLFLTLQHFFSPDDEHDVLETCRELKIKINT
jgi:hypothetical protein